MAHHIFPTENNVGTTDGYPSRDLREKNLANHIMRRGRSKLNSFVTWGMTLSAGSGLSVNVASGYAIINGYQIYSDASENLAGLTASNTNYIWAALTKDGNGLVTGYALSANITGTPPTDSVLIGIAVTGAATVTSFQNSILNPTTVTGTYTGNQTADRTIFLGFQPKYVLVFYVNYGSSKLRVGFSSINPSANGFYADADLAETDGKLRPAGNNSQSPYIVTFGFQVGLGLNLNAVSYQYVAWI